MTKNVNVLELAAELAESRVASLYEFRPIEELYQDPSAECLTYTEEAQDDFNYWYDWYEGKISEVQEEEGPSAATIGNLLSEIINQDSDEVSDGECIDQIFKVLEKYNLYTPKH